MWLFPAVQFSSQVWCVSHLTSHPVCYPHKQSDRNLLKNLFIKEGNEASKQMSPCLPLLPFLPVITFFFLSNIPAWNGNTLEHKAKQHLSNLGLIWDRARAGPGEGLPAKAQWISADVDWVRQLNQLYHSGHFNEIAEHFLSFGGSNQRSYSFSAPSCLPCSVQNSAPALVALGQFPPLLLDLTLHPGQNLKKNHSLLPLPLYLNHVIILLVIFLFILYLYFYI